MMLTAKLLHLLHLCDPALPIGGFSHSAGLETYVQQGIINDKVSAYNFVSQQLSANVLHNDAAIASLTWQAAATGELQEIIKIDDLCSAIKLPVELRTASQKLGTRLLKIFSAANTARLLREYIGETATGNTRGHYPVVFALVAQTFGLTKEETLTGFYYNTATGFVTNCVKLIPLGQQQGQEILLSILQLIETLVPETLLPDERKLGICCSGFDLASMQHETLYSRLYMS